MTTASTNWVPSATTAAVMRAAIRAYSDLLTAVGVLKTADTGQVDIDTAPYPTTVSTSTPTYVGYEVRALPAPGKQTLYLRIEYGLINSGNAADPTTWRITIRVTVSTSTDGAGNLNGLTLPQPVSAFSSSSGPTSSVSTTTIRPLHMASDGKNYLTVISDPGAIGWTAGSDISRYGYLDFALERSINALTGEYDTEALVVFNPFTALSTSNAVGVLNFPSSLARSGGANIGYQTPGRLWDNSGSLTQATIMPCTVCVPTPKGPARATVLAYSADVTRGGQYQVNMYGQLVTYMAVGPVYTQSSSGEIAVGLVRPLLRFD